jgi:hypothetical protein
MEGGTSRSLSAERSYTSDSPFGTWLFVEGAGSADNSREIKLIQFSRSRFTQARFPSLLPSCKKTFSISYPNLPPL